MILITQNDLFFYVEEKKRDPHTVAWERLSAAFSRFLSSIEHTADDLSNDITKTCVECYINAMRDAHVQAQQLIMKGGANNG